MEDSEKTPLKSNPPKDVGYQQKPPSPKIASNSNTSTTNGTTIISSNGEDERRINQHSNKKRITRRKNERRKQIHDKNSNTDNNNMCLLNNRNETKKQVTSSSGRSCVAKRKRNGRVVRLISIDSNDNQEGKPTISRMTSVPSLPRNQYKTTLRRRSIRKLEIEENKVNNNLIGLDDEYGDISLGMKLIVVGGRVIVQSLNSLEAGLASPAQLVGVIQRGDVLLAIGNLSLINLSVDQLMEGLSPLSTPDSRGYYQRFLDIRFEAEVGLGLLKIHEEEHARSHNNVALQEPMFSLFPMVDQLSGRPLFVDEIGGANGEDDGGYNEEEKDKFPCDDVLVLERKITDESINVISKKFDALVSSTLAKERYVDRERYESEYFDWREDFSDLLRRSVSMATDDANDQGKRLTKTERLELGKKIMAITKVLELNMEDMDKGRDQQSFKNRNTGFCFRSGASARRRHGMDTTTMSDIRPGYDTPMEAATDEESIDSGGSLEDIDADKLLLGLAARDRIWRKQVIDVLNKAAEDIENFGEEKTKDSIPQHGGKELTQQLGHFLFGETSSRNSKQDKRSISFPPQEITRVLFDLTTYIATYGRDEASVFGASSKLSSNISSFRSVTTRAGVGGRAAIRVDLLLAERFILDEALPQWLKTFRPLSLEQRKVLWPRLSNRTDSLSGTFTGTANRSEYTGRSSDGDSLTIDSGGSRTQTSIAQSRKKDMRELVDYHQVESQPETCFLVTYFFTQKLINSDPDATLFAVNRNSFVEVYGAYLQIQTCLSFAASVKDEIAISLILKAARNDPNHRDAIKEIQKSNYLLFYDQSKLSALVQSLNEIRYESEGERRKLIRDLCVSAYPDIQPWQVRKPCLSPRQSDLNEMRESCSTTVMEEIYYVYLSHLLNPLDGNEAARQDTELVKEFCEWSVGIKPRRNKNPTRMKNFINIVARSSIHHTRYRRDLMMLLDLSLAIDKEDLALDLVDEILGNKKLSSNKDALHRALSCLRRIGGISLVASSYALEEAKGFQTLRRVLKLFEKMASNDSLICRRSIIVADELFTLLQQWKIQIESNGDDPKMFVLVDFLIKESSLPADVIRALTLWSSSNQFGDSLLPRLEDLLCRGIHFSTLNGELSGTLLRLKHARTMFKELASTPVDKQEKKLKSSTTRGIWERMATGNLSIDK